MWAWQKKQYGKGEDPIDEWRKRRESGQISDLENQYGDPKEVGGIPIPGASFGVGGEFGVGGKVRSFLVIHCSRKAISARTHKLALRITRHNSLITVDASI